ncbi:MAG: hypothetical protein IKS68_03585 [Mailhella sp.]|nr:hypothetical protein [Mailhella sp.]
MKSLFPALCAAILLLAAIPCRAVDPQEDALRACAGDSGICQAERDSPWCMATCITLRDNVGRALHGMRDPEDIGRAVRNMEQDWDAWRDSALFRMKDPRDMQAYGSLYALRALCAALRLAAAEWMGYIDDGARQATLEKACRLEEECLSMEAPMAQILRRQSHDEGIIRRLDIMQGLFAHTKFFYACSTERRRIFARLSARQIRKEAE